MVAPHLNNLNINLLFDEYKEFRERNAALFHFKFLQKECYIQWSNNKVLFEKFSEWFGDFDNKKLKNHDLFVHPLPEFRQLDEKYIEYKKKLVEVNSHYKENFSKSSVKKFFSNDEKAFYNKVLSLQSTLDEIEGLMKAIPHKYSEHTGSSISYLQNKYPFLELRDNFENHKMIDFFEKGKIFESEEFIRLEKIAFSKLKEKITLNMLYNMMKFVQSDPKTYFLNYNKFVKYFGGRYDNYSYNKGVNIIFCHVEYYDLFLKNNFFEIMESINTVYNNRWLGIPGEFNISIDSFLSMLSIYKGDYGRKMDDNDPKIIEIRDSLKILSSSKLKIDTTAGIIPIFRLAVGMNVRFAKFLVRSGIRNLKNTTESNILIRDVLPLAERYFYFENDKYMDEYWKNTVDNNLKEAYYFYLFLKAYVMLGRTFFDSILSQGIALNSVDLTNIDEDIRSGAAPGAHYAELFLMNKKNYANDKRKVAVITVPGSDHNQNFSDEAQNAKKIPRDKYIVHIFTITNTLQLAHMLKEVSREKKIDILIIGGHGNETLTDLGFGKNGYLTEESLKNKAFNGIDKCFNHGAVCYLASCSTGGGDNPVASHVAKRFGIPTFAPNTPSHHGIMMDGENLVVKYENDAKQKMLFKPS